MLNPTAKPVSGRVRPHDPEQYYATDASRQTLTVSALDRGYGYQKHRNPASLQELNDTWQNDSGSSYLDTLADIWILAHETRECLKGGN